MFVVSCLLEGRALNLPHIMIHTIADSLRLSRGCLPFGRHLTLLLRALGVDPGTESALPLSSEYTPYTEATLHHMGLTRRGNEFYNSRRDFAARRAAHAAAQAHDGSDEESDDASPTDLETERAPRGDASTGRSTEQGTSSRTASDLYDAMGRLELQVAQISDHQTQISDRQTQMEQQLA
ncbi:uncharacterized protein LOC110607211 [Manihot esculenta]|uniref:uncharacterized protein LOC110607211 n=1 Tax=Manihot esculenta TaxID=3983 RepID=UPI000B5D4D41|nr:uncharacterized protein LOC110607211 [Manihot esculenta]XP_021601980.1 uncharacterized protein LOC110607211 [Manihot esculenta]